MRPYIHHIPGRLRIRSSVIKNNAAAAEAALVVLAALAGVRTAQANAVTGSLTIQYNPRVTDLQSIVDSLSAHGYMNRDVDIPATDHRKKVMGRLAKAAGRTLANAILEKAVERSTKALVAALI